MSAPIPDVDDVDVIIVERRRDVRIIVSVPGRYWLPNRWNSGREPERLACRAINISPQAIAFAAPVQGAVGDWVKSEVEHFGRLEGPILRLLDDRGFVMHIATSEGERRELAGRIDWFELHKNHEVGDRRSEARFVPDNPHARLAFHDGTFLECFILDLSVSGAAIAASTLPKPGTFLAVGKVIGQVVRHLVGGFAVRFIEPQNRQSIEGLVSRKWVGIP
jgi:PilZ domain